MKINNNTAGLSLGALFGIMHLLWISLVGFGMGQPVANWSYGMHFIGNMPQMMGFGVGTGIFGIILALILGYVIGYVFALLWNFFDKK